MSQKVESEKNTMIDCQDEIALAEKLEKKISMNFPRKQEEKVSLNFRREVSEVELLESQDADNEGGVLLEEYDERIMVHIENYEVRANVQINVLLEIQDKDEDRVLCIDGGGVKGVVEGAILKYLHFCLQKHHTGEVKNLAQDLREFIKSENNKENKNIKYDATAQPEIYRMFDMIVGTSTGSIIASAIARLHWNPTEIIEKAHDIATEVFPKASSWNLFGRFKAGTWSTLSLVTSSVTKYSPEPIEKYLKKELGSCKWEQKDTKYGEDDREDPVLGIVCTHLETSAIHIFDNRKYVDSDVFIHDAVRASTAAPTYFPPKAIKANKFGDNVDVKNKEELKKYNFIDGGLTANCPANYAMSLLDTESRLAMLLSIGIGDSDPSTQPIVKILDATMNNEEKWNSFVASHPHERNCLFRLTPSKEANIGSYDLADSGKLDEMQGAYEKSLLKDIDNDDSPSINDFLISAKYLFAKSLYISSASSTLIDRKKKQYRNTMIIKSKYNDEEFTYDQVNIRDGVPFEVPLQRSNKYAKLKPIVLKIEPNRDTKRIHVKYQGIEIIGSPIHQKFEFIMDDRTKEILDNED